MEGRASITSISSPPYSLSFPLPLPPLRNYDVFLSHRAKDTGRGFAADLHEALESEGIVVYRDEVEVDEEDGGKALGEKMKAVEESRSSIVVLSENYGNLVCMKEVEKIVMCMESMDQLVLPIFYKIDPANVRKQLGNFENHFNEHEANPGIHIQQLQSWRYSMNQLGHLSGWHLQHSQLSYYQTFHFLHFFLFWVFFAYVCCVILYSSMILILFVVLFVRVHDHIDL